MKIYMFPGQGSQEKQMGGDLFDAYRELTDKADAILGYSIRELCLEDPRDELGKTQFTQPALYVVNALSYYRKLEEAGRAPDFVAGHSLGEFNALLAAGCFDFETGLKLVRRRGEMMAQVTNGAMAAVVNASKEEIEQILVENRLTNLTMANHNTPVQVVLSGLEEEIARAEPFFTQGKMRYYPLATSGAFHSAFMKDAMHSFEDYLAQFEFAAPRIPVIANVTARPYSADAILGTLAAQIASPVRWCETVQYLMAVAARRGQAADFEEVGHGDVLTRLYYTIKQLTPQDAVDALAARIAAEEPAGEAAKPRSAHDKVSAWNRQHPVSTRCKSAIVAGVLETRTAAMVLFGHRAAVYMKGYNGYFDLDELTPA
ncbi:malonyl CoA-acyl carrier protein transacylase [Pseudoduganella flava]|uniref:[acyl-carrier-protein] S-malonyltransferase n=1 Tax=Pseudoduganella flava TaxID=871742 RepID=A0A562PHN8_9BURK|nr:ACP S-malonyltransferase [Pseudoduganella flava]QGZ37645.1 ACP S-malonyltransferase [Pseudoduganella flava]TWI43992.1 malonyl CoA-acyl carrier protein transacylase [Pseudoduganella flava]